MTVSPDSIAIAFYNSFREKNANEMISNYHPDLIFNDPAFGDLTYTEACAMWQMLCESAKDLNIEFRVLSVDGNIIRTQWIAEYTFSKTKRFVRNEIIAKMTISEGKIIEHIDTFDLHKWAKQALGLQGWLLGGTNFFKNKLHETTGRQLKRYLEKVQGE